MASVRETRKIAVEEAFVPALGVGLPVEEAIPVLPQNPDTVSDAASDDGPPKADTFFTFVREHSGPALRCTVPILIYAVAVPTLCVHVPLTGNVILPVASGNITLASMSSASAHGYLEADGLIIY